MAPPRVGGQPGSRAQENSQENWSRPPTQKLISPTVSERLIHCQPAASEPEPGSGAVLSALLSGFYGELCGSRSERARTAVLAARAGAAGGSDGARQRRVRGREVDPGRGPRESPAHAPRMRALVGSETDRAGSDGRSWTRRRAGPGTRPHSSEPPAVIRVIRKDGAGGRQNLSVGESVPVRSRHASLVASFRRF